MKAKAIMLASVIVAIAGSLVETGIGWVPDDNILVIVKRDFV